MHFKLILLTVLCSSMAQAIPCGAILKKAKQLPKDGKGKAPCVLESQETGPRRGSFIAHYYCSEEKKRYALEIEEDLSCVVR